MNKLIEVFEHQVKSSTTSTKRTEVETDIIVHVEGSLGTAEMEFSSDGEISGIIQTDFIHTWTAYPTEAEMRACARKIREMIE